MTQGSAHGGAGNGPPRGKHRDFDKACEAAYEAARAAGLEPPYTVNVQLTGDNPFGGYIITVGP